MCVGITSGGGGPCWDKAAQVCPFKRALVINPHPYPTVHEPMTIQGTWPSLLWSWGPLGVQPESGQALTLFPLAWITLLHGSYTFSECNPGSHAGWGPRWREEREGELGSGGRALETLIFLPHGHLKPNISGVIRAITTLPEIQFCPVVWAYIRQKSFSQNANACSPI